MGEKNMGSVVDSIMALKDVYAIIPVTCTYRT